MDFTGPLSDKKGKKVILVVIDRLSQYVRTNMSDYTEKGIKQIVFPVVDHRGCGLVARCIQTFKRSLGTMQLDPNFNDFQSAIKLNY